MESIELLDLEIERKRVKELEQSSLLFKNIVESEKFEKKRNDFKPSKTKILFVGESRPFGGTFFYDENSNLYEYTKEAFNNVGIDFSLAKFKEMGCWLYDVCKEPIDFIKSNSEKRKIIEKYIPDLIKIIKALSPKYIIVVKKTCMEKVFAAILESGYSKNINAFNTSFPTYGHQNKYVDELKKILRNIL